VITEKRERTERRPMIHDDGFGLLEVEAEYALEITLL
jgi:hypothetical protein